MRLRRGVGKYLKMITTIPVNGFIHYSGANRSVKIGAKKRDPDLPIAIYFNGPPKDCFRFSHVGRIVVYVNLQLMIVENGKVFQI
jgi:hypothetical protein